MAVITATHEAIRNRSRQIHQVDPVVFPRQSGYDPVKQTGGDIDDTESAEGMALVAALLDYSGSRPRRLSLVVDTAVAYNVYYMTDLIPDWLPERWNILDIQWPLEEDAELFMDRASWRETVDPKTGRHILRFIGGAPSSPYGIVYSAPHEHRLAKKCTVPIEDQDLVAYRVAFFALEAATNYYARKSELASLAADAVEYRSISNRYAASAKNAMAQYDRYLGRKARGRTSGFVSWSTNSSFGGPWMFHPRVYPSGS